MHKKWITNIGLLLLATAIAVLPLVIVKDSEFGGADEAAVEAIAAIKEDFEPWFQPLWEPPGGETESLIFALQAALGAGVICYCIGYMRGRGKNTKDN